MSTKIMVSAPGKIILHGEHAVVYKKLAIAASLNRRNYATITTNEYDYLNGIMSVEFPDVKLQHKICMADIQSELIDKMEATRTLQSTPEHLEQLVPMIDTFIRKSLEESVDGPIKLSSAQMKAYTAFLYLYVSLVGKDNTNYDSMEVYVKSDLQVSSGTGSSAAFCTSLAGALLLLVKPKITNDYKFTEDDLHAINKWAALCEQIMHGGASSGVDPAICTYGSFVKFRKGAPIEKVPFNHPLRIMLVDTKVPRDTQKMVDKLAVFHRKYPDVADRIFDAIEAVSTSALENLEKISEANDNSSLLEYYNNLMELLNTNQNLLSALGASHETLDIICGTVIKYKFGAKLTGAGGGGYAIIVLPPNLCNDVEYALGTELYKLGFLVFTVVIGCPGVRIEEINIPR